MIFDLRAAHLGDVLLAMPAMIAGDSVIARPEHRVPGLPVKWLDSGHGLHPHALRGVHMTDAWLAAADREPVRHQLLPAADRTLTVIAPDVAAPDKQWHGWLELGQLLLGAAWIGATEARDKWMALINRAHTVICPDTGTAHMADALGVPRVVALYGRGFDMFAPYWSRQHCVVRDSMEKITVSDVMEAAHG